MCCHPNHKVHSEFEFEFETCTKVACMSQGGAGPAVAAICMAPPHLITCNEMYKDGHPCTGGHMYLSAGLTGRQNVLLRALAIARVLEIYRWHNIPVAWPWQAMECAGDSTARTLRIPGTLAASRRAQLVCGHAQQHAFMHPLWLALVLPHSQTTHPLKFAQLAAPW